MTRIESCNCTPISIFTVHFNRGRKKVTYNCHKIFRSVYATVQSWRRPPSFITIVYEFDWFVSKKKAQSKCAYEQARIVIIVTGRTLYERQHRIMCIWIFAPGKTSYQPLRPRSLTRIFIWKNLQSLAIQRASNGCTVWYEFSLGNISESKFSYIVVHLRKVLFLVFSCLVWLSGFLIPLVSFCPSDSLEDLDDTK